MYRCNASTHNAHKSRMNIALANKLNSNQLSMSKTTIVYYLHTSGENPVKNFIDSLPNAPKSKVFRILQYIEIYGLLGVLPHVKKLSGTPLWEIRLLGKDNIRIVYAIVINNQVLLLHGFRKKTQKIPHSELKTALNRLANWK